MHENEEKSYKELKEQEYKLYIIEHINNFNIARRLYLFDIVECLERASESNLIEAIYSARTIGIMAGLIKHDTSKHSEEEFEGYRQYFYPVEGEEKNKELFNNAWKHHYSNNRHHWEYWLSSNLADRILREEKVHRNDIRDNEEVSDMHILSLIEMILDWVAMGIKFNNTPQDFYNKNKDYIILGDRTRNILEYILDNITFN